MRRACCAELRVTQGAFRTLLRFCALLGALGIGCRPTAEQNSDGGGDAGGNADCLPPAPIGGSLCCDVMVTYVCVNGTWEPPYICLCRGDACGDGKLDQGETCDDGNVSAGDGCSSTCQVEANWTCPTPGQPCTKTSRCGDSDVTSDETCDDGNAVDGDGCSADCQTVEAGWQCRVPGSPCTPQPSSCLGVQMDAGQTCDAGATGSSICGDGLVTGDEECDDGNDPVKYPHNDDSAYGGCTTACKFGPYCGDGICNGPEECDVGPANALAYGHSGCTVACTNSHYCGDGILDADRGEQCDLGDANGQFQLSGHCTADCEVVVY
jgi:cysteine-rich repeat protein